MSLGHLLIRPFIIILVSISKELSQSEYGETPLLKTWVKFKPHEVNKYWCSVSFLYCSLVLLFYGSMVVLLYTIVRSIVISCNCFGYWLSVTIAPRIKFYWCKF